MPDLARSLVVLGQILRSDKPLNARDCFAEGIELLTPVFLRYPAGLASLMGRLAQEYLATVKQMNEMPDVLIVTDILAGPVGA